MMNKDEWFKDVWIKDVLFEDVWFKDMLFDDVWLKDKDVLYKYVLFDDTTPFIVFGNTFLGDM